MSSDDESPVKSSTRTPFQGDLEARFLSRPFSKNEGYVSNSDEEESDSQTGSPSYPLSKMPTSRKTSSTGPKGVIQDYKEYVRRLEEERRANAASLVSEAKRLTLAGDTIPNGEDSDEERFLRAYQAKRMQEVADALAKGVPKFGELRQIQRHQYIQAIDDEDNRVFVVIHLFDQHIAACQAMNKSLSALARAYPVVKFRAIVAREASTAFETGEGLPALLIYKAGELIANLVGVEEELEGDLSYESVEGLLARHGALQSLPQPLNNGRRFDDSSDDD